MARPKDHSKHVALAVADLVNSVSALVGAVQGAVAGKAGTVKKASTEKGKKLQSSLKSYWANLKGKAREERIRVMLAGRGLKRKIKK